MIAFYSIRKLIEAHKLPASIERLTVPVVICPAKRRTEIHYFNRYDIERHFYLNRGKRERRPLFSVCNQVVHSYVFCLSMNKVGNLRSVYVCSDLKRREELMKLDANTIADVFERVGTCQQSKLRAVADEKRGDYKIEVS